MTVETETDNESVDSQVDDSQTEDTSPVQGEEALGDPGKKALDAMKAQRKAAQDEARALKAELDALRAREAGREAEHAAEVEKQKAKDEALAAANRRILSAELRSAAKGRLADPSDAGLYINLSEFDVSDDGEVDTTALNTAIDDLLSRKPHLAATGRRFQGDADGGARQGDPQLRQLSDADLESMTSAQINEARKNGQLDKLLGRSS
jgi:hypothetical protein